MDARRRPKILIAHRGASAYAPEHTLEAYELAIQQGADFIEPDLQITRDGVLICLHDLTLERTTDAKEVFPDRYREEPGSAGQVRRWHAADFAFQEIRRLDAGSWFGPRFASARVPTLTEAIVLARGRAGIYPETKAPEVYGARGFGMERMLLEVLERHSLSGSGGGDPPPVIVQSFSPESLKILRSELGSDVPLVLLVGQPASTLGEANPWEHGFPEPGLSREGLTGVSKFADGLGPAKGLLLENPQIVQWAQEAGLTVVPWTFRADDPGGFGNVSEEMSYFLYELGVDGLFTNNPDLFPR